MDWKTAAKLYHAQVKSALREIDQQMNNTKYLADHFDDEEETLYYHAVISGLQLAERIVHGARVDVLGTYTLRKLVRERGDEDEK